MTAEVATIENIESAMPVSTKLVDVDDETSSCGNHSDGPNLSDSDPKDSGIECGSTEQKYDSEIPDEETADAILKMVEFYLSDANILKDPFLLKHVRRNKEGYVSLKLLASFRKVRSLSRNWKAVAYSIQKSAVLALNPEGTKVKRLTPLPDYDETVSSRSIIVSGFSSDKPSVDSVSEMFSKCGDIALVRILRPGGSIPSDVKRFLSKNPSLQSEVCALVEFEEHAAARKALESIQAPEITVTSVTIKDKANPESPKKTQTTESSAESPKESPKKKKKNRKGSNADKKSLEKENTASEQKRSRRSSSGSVSSQSSGYLSSSPVSNPFESKFPRRHSYHPVIYNDPNSSFASLANRHNGSRDRLHKGFAESTDVLSPWRRRREQMMLSDSNLVSTSTSSMGSLLQSLPVKTIRMPRGPDGTNGFCTRGRSRLPSTAE
ncbi:la-related protein 6 [Trichonephila inaurata madagascariensis]|uniref:La-related protein 6 n=1 Tax=Trichonephila inaurata madagascariensis TaxID=2747483 RepID=A0A8X6XNQ1_9ARAC|nr:la-related protein 6 [Trichonephila inaurata madagascariensis]